MDIGEYDSAITKCRTLLEEVFCYVIEKKGEEPSQKGDINKLYKQVKDLYNMHADASVDKRINELLSGLEKVIDAIAEMQDNLFKFFKSQTGIFAVVMCTTFRVVWFYNTLAL